MHDKRRQIHNEEADPTACRLRNGCRFLSERRAVLKDIYLKAAYPERHIMGGGAYVAATIARPGVNTSDRADAAVSERAECFYQACQHSRIAIEISEDKLRNRFGVSAGCQISVKV